MFGKEKFEEIFKRIDEIEIEIKDIRNQLDNEIKVIEKAGKPISNEITKEIKGDFYNNPLRDITQSLNNYFDSVISREKLDIMIIEILDKYELDSNVLKNYFLYLEKSNMIVGMMDKDKDGFYPIYSIHRDIHIPNNKSDRGIFNELNMS